MTETLATLSNNSLYSATVVYALAMLAHVAEWAMAHTLPADVPLPGRGRRGALVPSGPSSSSVGGGEPPPVVPLPPAASAEEVERSDRYGRIGLALTVLGLLLHAVGVVSRGLAAERARDGELVHGSPRDSLAVAAAYLFLVRRYRIRWLGLLVTGFLLVVLGIALLVLYGPVAPLVPALYSYWLAIHVSAAASAGGAFTVGALASVLYLLRSRLEAKAAAQPTRPRRGFLWRTPSAVDIDRVAYRVHAFAFPLWTFAVLAGAIWAEYAWGRYWGWDPKEVWALITWVVYAAYLHARATAGWQGRAAAYVALLGYATFIFNFVGINLFGSGLHAYSGL